VLIIRQTKMPCEGNPQLRVVAMAACKN